MGKVSAADGTPARATVDFGAGMQDAVTGETFAGCVALDLPPWEFRSFVESKQESKKEQGK